MKIRDMLRKYDTKAYAVCGCQIELIYRENFKYPRWTVKDRVLCNYHKAKLRLAQKKD